MQKKQQEHIKRRTDLKLIMKRRSPLRVVRHDVAGIDLGSKSHFVAIPNPANPEEVLIQEFPVFTSGLESCIKWFRESGIRSVVMEATGVYWMHFFFMLEDAGFEVILANAKHVKNVSAKKTDILDAEWLMQLHSYGLLEGAFVPESQVNALRTFCRFRAQAIKSAGQAIQRMQKALIAMNLRLDNVINDISGKTGISIIEAIVAGERDSKVLANLRDGRCKRSGEEIEEALKGYYRDDLVFCLKQALEEWKFHVSQIRQCDERIKKQLDQYPSKMPPEMIEETKKSKDVKERKTRNSRHERVHEFRFDLRKELMRITGVDLLCLPGFRESTALTILSEIGTDMSRWPTAKHFCSWAKLAPNNMVSGGRVQRNGNSKKSTNVSRALRMAVTGLYRDGDTTALGAFFKHQKYRKGARIATTAAAHKLAKMVYYLLKTGKEFEEPGAEAYLEQQKHRRIKNMRAQLNEWGYTVKKKEVLMEPEISLASG